MPSIIKPESSFIYGDYTISENVNIVACPMSNMQFNKYAEAWRAEKKKSLMQQMRRHLHQDVPFDYHISSYAAESNNLEILKNNGYHIFGTIPGIASMAEMSQYCENEDSEYDAFDKTDRSTTAFPDGTTGQRKYLFEDFNNSVGEKITDFLESNTMKEPWFYYIHSHDLHPHKITVPKEFDDEKFGKNKYERVISSMDKWVHDIISKIDLSKTLVVITSDHGIHYPINEQGYSYFEPKFETELNIGKKIMPHSTHKIGAKMIVALRNKIRDSRLKKVNEGLSPYEIRSRRPHVTLSIAKGMTPFQCNAELKKHEDDIQWLINDNYYIKGKACNFVMEKYRSDG